VTGLDHLATKILLPLSLVALLGIGCATNPDVPGRGAGRAHYDRAVAFYAKGDYQRAIESYQLAIQERPNLTDAHFGLGVAFVRTEFYRGAILALGRALELRSPFAEAHYNLGVAYHRLERYGEAVHHYGISRRQDPGLEGVTLSRGPAFEQ